MPQSHRQETGDTAYPGAVPMGRTGIGYPIPAAAGYQEPRTFEPMAACGLKGSTVLWGVSFRKVSAKRKASCRRRDQAWVSISPTASATARSPQRLWERPRYL